MGRLVEVGATPTPTPAEPEKPKGRLVEVAPESEKKGRLVEAAKFEPPKDPASFGGTAADIGIGAAAGLAKIPGEIGKIGLAVARAPEAIVQQFVPSFHVTQDANDWIDQVHHTIDQKLGNDHIRGYSTNIGPIEISGRTVGELLSGAVIPAGIFGEAAKGASFGMRAWKAAKTGMAFSAATSVPDVVLSRNMKQAEERALNAAVSIGVGGLMAGALHMTMEGAGTLLHMREAVKAGTLNDGPARVPKVEPTRPPSSVPKFEPEELRGLLRTPRFAKEVASWRRIAEHNPEVQSQWEKLDPVLRQARMNPASVTPEQLASLAGEIHSFERSVQNLPHGGAEVGVAEDRRTRWQHEDQDQSIIRKENELKTLQTEIEQGRVEIANKGRLVSEFKKRGLFNEVQDRMGMTAEGEEIPIKKGLLSELKELAEAQRAREVKRNELNAEIDGIAEVIAQRGFPLGEVWEPTVDKAFANQFYNAEVADAITRRIGVKKEALKGASPSGVADAHRPLEIPDFLQDVTDGLEKISKLPHEMERGRVAQAANQVLADNVQTMAKVHEETRSFFRGIADAYRKAVNPVSFLDAKTKGVLSDVLGLSDQVEAMLPRLREKIIETFPELEERQVFALLNDPRGVAFLNGMKISPKLDAMITLYRDAYNKMFNVAVREGVLSPQKFWEDFVNRIYDKKTAAKMMEFLEQRQTFSDKNSHSFERVFPHLWEAQKAGFKSKTLDIANLFEEYVRSMNRTITNNRLIQQLEAVAPEKFTYRKDGFVSSKFAKAPDGLLGNVTREGLVRYLDKDVHRVVNNLLSQSRPKGKIDAWNMWNKRIKLAIDVYHYWQVHRGALSMNWENPFGKWQEGKAMALVGHEKYPTVQKLIKGGLTAQMGDVGRVDFDRELTYLTKYSKWGAKLFNLIKTPVDVFSNHLWNEVAPGLKIRTAVKNLERLMEDPRFNHLNEAELYEKAAQMTNKVFGGSPWREFGRSATFERNARLLVLAPNWIETRFRLFGGALKAGTEAARFKAPTPEGSMYGRYWIGYVAQGLATAAFANTIIRTAFPDVKKHKEANGLGMITHITFPVEDRNGRPLVMSPYPGIDYIMEAVDDWDRFYKNRMSPAMYLVYHALTGQDYKGAKDRPAAWSFDTFMHVVQDAIPFPMVLGGMERPATSETPGYETTKALARGLVLGLHNHPTYPVQLRDTEDFLRNEAAALNQKMRGTKVPFLKSYYRMLAARHNAKVRAWIEDARKTEGAEKILATLPKYQRQLFVGE